MSRLISIKDKNGIAKQVDFTTPRPKIDYVQWLNQASGLDITSYTIDNADILRQDIKSKGIEFDGMQNMGTMTLIDYLYKKSSDLALAVLHLFIITLASLHRLLESLMMILTNVKNDKLLSMVGRLSILMESL